MLPGPQELILLTNTDRESAAVESILKKVKTLVLKRGKKDCEIFSENQRSAINVPSFQIKEVDPTGAGDAFDAGFLCGYLEGKNLYDCGVLANACGAINAMKLGPMEGIAKIEITNKFIENKKTK